MEALEQIRLKAWLNQARPDSEVRQLENSVERLRRYQMGAGLKLEGVERYAGLVKEYVGELQTHAAEVRAVIGQVSDEREKAVLTLRYCEGLTWEQIAERMNYCTVNLHRIHRAALESVKAVLERQEQAPATLDENCTESVRKSDAI